MEKIFPDVDKGSEITGIRTDTTATLFFHNGLEIGRIDDPNFTNAFFKIWLGPQTSAPDLRKKLLGAS
jgi:hypothetical protein